jgi:hypothetical protein
MAKQMIREIARGSKHAYAGGAGISTLVAAALRSSRDTAAATSGSSHSTRKAMFGNRL